MNRLVTACRAFTEALKTTQTPADTREQMLTLTRGEINRAEETVRRLEAELETARKRVAVLNVKLEQLERLPDEAFSVLIS